MVLGISFKLLDPNSESFSLSAQGCISEVECPCSFLFYNLSTYFLFYMYPKGFQGRSYSSSYRS